MTLYLFLLPEFQHILILAAHNSFSFFVSLNINQLTCWLSSLPCFLFANVGSAELPRRQTHDHCFRWVTWDELSHHSALWSYKVSCRRISRLELDEKSCNFSQLFLVFVCQSHYGLKIRSVWDVDKNWETFSCSVNAAQAPYRHTDGVAMAWEQGLLASAPAQLK